MFNDLKTKRALDRMCGIEERITNDIVKDYRLLEELKEELEKKGIKYALQRERANLGLTYLLLFYPSPLVRHEAAFVIGEYGQGHNSFLRSCAYLDPDATVRHEAALAMSTPSQKSLAHRNKWILEYIAKHDQSQMVRDTAKVSLGRIKSMLEIEVKGNKNCV